MLGLLSNIACVMLLAAAIAEIARTLFVHKDVVMSALRGEVRSVAPPVQPSASPAPRLVVRRPAAPVQPLRAAA